MRVGGHHHVRRGQLEAVAGLRPAAQARLPVPHQDRNGDPPRARHRIRVLLVVQALLVLSPLRLVPVILEPNLHLRGRQPYYRSQMLPLRGRQVPLLPESPFELVRLRLREQDSPLPLLVAAAGRRLLLLLRFFFVEELFVASVVRACGAVVAVAAGGLHLIRPFRDRRARAVWAQLLVMVMVDVCK